MTKHPSYRARDQPESGSASQHRKEKIMHKFEKRDAKSRTLVILAVVGLAAALTLGIFTAVRLIRKPAASKDDPKTSIVYDSSAVEGGWDNLSPEEIAERLNQKVEEGMINISMNTAPYFENGAAEGNIMIVSPTVIAIAAAALYWLGIQKIASCGNTFAQTLCFAIAVLLTAIFFWICPLLSRFELRPGEAWRIAFYCTIRHFSKTAMLLLAAFAGGSLIWIFPLAAIFVPCMLMALASRTLEPVLVCIAKSRLKNQSDSSKADLWYLSE